MDKEQFIKRIRFIQNFISEQYTIQAMINKFTDGNSVVITGDSLIDELIKATNQQLNIEDEGLLFWWLYEDVDKNIYVEEDNDKEQRKISVETLEELYDYIREFYGSGK